MLFPLHREAEELSLGFRSGGGPARGRNTGRWWQRVPTPSPYAEPTLVTPDASAAQPRPANVASAWKVPTPRSSPWKCRVLLTQWTWGVSWPRRLGPGWMEDEPVRLQEAGRCASSAERGDADAGEPGAVCPKHGLSLPRLGSALCQVAGPWWPGQRRGKQLG